MLLAYIFVLSGALLLYIGAEALVAGASRLAARLGVPPLVIGLTVVSLCTSLPEAVASLFAQFNGGLGNLALGNVIGSNIANIGLILGTTVLIRSVEVHRDIVKREIPILLLVTFLVTFLMMQGDITRFSGGVLLLGLLIYVVYEYWQGSQTPEEDNDVLEVEGPFANIGEQNSSLLILLGLGALTLVFGGYLLIDGAVTLAQHWGVSYRVIGLSIVAIGTSLPELATSVVAALRGNSDISVGNVVGSNIFNLLFIVGGVATVAPIRFDKAAMLGDAMIMILYTCLLWGLCSRRLELGRKSGSIFLGSYLIYMATLFSS